MPRRHRAARERASPPISSLRPAGVAPEWASAEDVTVRAVAGDKSKAYRCPGCQQEIRPGTAHFVVVTHGDMEGRRHWHTPCWHQELRRRGPT